MLSNVPLGADFSPFAPWRQVDPETEPCSECNGTGYHYWAACTDEMHDVECSREFYLTLPDTLEEAEARDYGYYKGEAYKCRECDGTGEIEIEPYEPDWDDMND